MKIRLLPWIDSALAYAVHRQCDRRNLTDADMLRMVAVMDERKTAKNEQPRDGGKFQPCAPSGVNGDEPPSSSVTPEPVRTSAKTAKILGVSPRKVERIRTVIDRPSESTSPIQDARMQPWCGFCDLCRWTLHHACTMGER